MVDRPEHLTEKPSAPSDALSSRAGLVLDQVAMLSAAAGHSVLPPYEHDGGHVTVGSFKGTIHLRKG